MIAYRGIPAKTIEVKEDTIEEEDDDDEEEEGAWWEDGVEVGYWLGEREGVLVDKITLDTSTAFPVCCDTKLSKLVRKGVVDTYSDRLVPKLLLVLDGEAMIMTDIATNDNDVSSLFFFSCSKACSVVRGTTFAILTIITSLGSNFNDTATASCNIDNRVMFFEIIAELGNPETMRVTSK